MVRRRRFLRLLLAPILLMILGGIAAFGLGELRRSQIDDRKEGLKDLVEVARSVIQIWHSKEMAGALTQDQAQQGARDELRLLRFADNYFFVQRYDGVTMVALDRSLEGKYRLEARDVDGRYPLRDLVAAAKRGGDYVYYRGVRSPWETAPKLSYAAPFEPWEWAICTGIYIDDIDTRYNSMIKIAYAVIGAAAFGLVAAVVFLGAMRLIALRRA